MKTSPFDLPPEVAFTDRLREIMTEKAAQLHAQGVSMEEANAWFIRNEKALILQSEFRIVQ